MDQTYLIKRYTILLRKENPDLIITSNLTDIYPKKIKEEIICLDKNIYIHIWGKELEEEVIIIKYNDIKFFRI